MSEKAAALLLSKLIVFYIIVFEYPVHCTKENLINNLSKNIDSQNDSIINSSPRYGTHSLSTEKAERLTAKKWQVGRVSRKHYEIVNMLWRKTKVFINPETTTAPGIRFKRTYPKATFNTKTENFKHTTMRPPIASTTPSYIEFYYLDDNDERIKRRDSLIPTMNLHTTQRKEESKNVFIRSPFLSFRTGDLSSTFSPKKSLPIETKTSESLFQIQKRANFNKNPIYGILSNKFKIGLVTLAKSNTEHYNKNDLKELTTEKYYNNETCPVTYEPEITSNSTKHQNKLDTPNGTQDINISTASSSVNITSHNIETTTSYDKIKFFEMYDQHTMLPINLVDRLGNRDDTENMVIEDYIDDNRKVNLEDVNRNLGHHDGTKIKNVKKHIDEKFASSPVPIMNNTNSEKKVKFNTVLFKVNKTIAKKSIKAENAYRAFKHFQNDSWIFVRNSSRIAFWSEYPFAAVYIYEPSQINCDAAALSPHWLVAAGSCLSRFTRKDPLSEGRSAFVAYCGQSWWHPERVSYVKYSIVHPSFHPKDNKRRFLYNIGLIQVVGSMSSCYGWAPVTLMSHNFAAGPDGTMATSVGWGLDRYDIRYTSADLPKFPLSAYNGYVYSSSCPGSKDIGKIQLYNDDKAIVNNNLYCLSLPPYLGEENDPVHGSLLLVEGKLIALYLQEERRAWGEQSAQYTGVWRLVPWVHEVAREPDDLDGFAIDI